MSGILRSIEPLGASGRKSRATITPWAFIPLFLLLHGIVATSLPGWLDPLSTVFIVMAEWIAVAACMRAWLDAPGIAIYWRLLAAAILLHSAAMSLDAIEETIRAPVLNHVPGIQVFLSMLNGVPLLVAVSLQNDRRVLRPARIVHAALAIAVGALIYFNLFSFLTVYGARNPSDEMVVTHLFDVIDFFLAAAATARWLGSNDHQERLFFRLLAGFLWLNTIFPAVHNRILMRHDDVWLDLLISAPYVILVPLIQTAQRHPAKAPSPVLVRAIRSGSPIFLAGALIAAGFITARTHFYVGLAAALFAIFAYGSLNILVQSHGLETEDSLMASNAALEKLAELDGLTAIANRRAFNERLDREFAASSRTQQPFSLLMIDVDRFKELNDTVGHVTGDEYLIQIAAALNSKLPRATDFVARYGGEEFAAILPATDGNGAMIAAERARKGVAGLGLKHPTTGVVTVSIGASTYEGSSLRLPSELLDSADRALYRAKQSGRNCSQFRLMDTSHAAKKISAVNECPERMLHRNPRFSKSTDPPTC